MSIHRTEYCAVEKREKFGGAPPETTPSTPQLFTACEALQPSVIACSSSSQVTMVTSSPAGIKLSFRLTVS